MVHDRALSSFKNIPLLLQLAKYSGLQPDEPSHDFNTVEGTTVQIMHVCMIEGVRLGVQCQRDLSRAEGSPPPSNTRDGASAVLPV